MEFRNNWLRTDGPMHVLNVGWWVFMETIFVFILDWEGHFSVDVDADADDDDDAFHCFVQLKWTKWEEIAPLHVKK